MVLVILVVIVMVLLMLVMFVMVLLMLVMIVMVLVMLLVQRISFLRSTFWGLILFPYFQYEARKYLHLYRSSILLKRSYYPLPRVFYPSKDHFPLLYIKKKKIFKRSKGSFFSELSRPEQAHIMHTCMMYDMSKSCSYVCIMYVYII